MSESTPASVSELLARVDGAWETLQRAVGGLDDAELDGARDPAGWAVKDHLWHLAAWERALLARLEGRPLHDGLGIDEAEAQGDDDAVNAAVFARNRHRASADIREAARATHAALRARLAALGEGDPARPPAPPGGAEGEAPGPPAWVAGSTWEHYAQHHGWIRRLLGGA